MNRSLYPIWQLVSADLAREVRGAFSRGWIGFPICKLTIKVEMLVHSGELPLAAVYLAEQPPDDPEGAVNRIGRPGTALRQDRLGNRHLLARCHGVQQLLDVSEPEHVVSSPVLLESRRWEVRGETTTATTSSPRVFARGAWLAPASTWPGHFQELCD